jgi:hypothetical protein
MNAIGTTPEEMQSHDIINIRIREHVLLVNRSLLANSNTGSCEYGLKESKTANQMLTDKVKASYSFSKEKAFLMLRTDIKESHNVSTVVATIPMSCECFGRAPVSWVIHNVVGYDTIMLNLMGRTFNEHGHLQKMRSGQIFSVQKYSSLRYMPSTDLFAQNTLELDVFRERIAYKLALCLTIIFLFFTTTSMVSFILKQTQSKMLKFTFLLQYHVHHNIPLTFLIFTHVLESLIFVPIMIGILFFMFEFFGDQLLAFLILSLVWLCEVYSSMRYAIFLLTF